MKSWPKIIAFLKAAARPIVVPLAAFSAGAVGYVSRLLAPSIFDFIAGLAPTARIDGLVGPPQLSRWGWWLAIIVEEGSALMCHAYLYLPMIFAAFAVGRRRLSIPLVIAFAFSESAAYALASSLWV